MVTTFDCQALKNIEDKDSLNGFILRAEIHIERGEIKKAKEVLFGLLENPNLEKNQIDRIALAANIIQALIHIDAVFQRNQQSVLNFQRKLESQVSQKIKRRLKTHFG